MLLLRCSFDADSMSRSISFWPSTMATRSSSACVALNSMRFMYLSPAQCPRGKRMERGGASCDAGDAYAAVAAEDGLSAGDGRQTRGERGGVRMRFAGPAGAGLVVAGLLVR